MGSPQYIYTEIDKAEKDRLMEAYYKFIDKDNSKVIEQRAILRYIKFLLQQ